MSVAARLDSMPRGRFHLYLLMITGLAWLLNSFNTNMISFILPVIVPHWQLTPTQAGFIGSAQVIGMLPGAIGFGYISDRLGRKLAFELSLLIFGLATVLGVLIDDYAVFTALRFVAGAGLGGMIPVVTTLAGELSPRRWRGFMVVAIDGFWAIGFLFTAAVALLVIPTLGWQAAFIVGALPLPYLLAVRLGLPESLRFLTERGRHVEAEAILRRIESRYARELPPIVESDAGSGRSEAKARIGELWSGPLRRRTVSIWFINFALTFTNYGIFTWLPVLVVAAGYSMTEAFQFMILVSFVQLPGKALAAFLVERVGRKLVIVVSSLLYATTAVFLGQAVEMNALIFWGCALSFVNAVDFGPVLTYSAESYPTRVRSTGTGAAMAIGRVGGILGPLMVGVLLGAIAGDRQVIFAVFGASMAIGALAVWMLGEETRGRSLEDIAA